MPKSMTFYYSLASSRDKSSQEFGLTVSDISERDVAVD